MVESMKEILNGSREKLPPLRSVNRSRLNEEVVPALLPRSLVRKVRPKNLGGKGGLKVKLKYLTET